VSVAGSLSADIRAAVGAAQGERNAIARRLARVSARHQSYRALFYDSETGELRPSAAYFLHDIARQAGMHRTSFSDSAHAMAHKSGMRDLVLFIMTVIDMDSTEMNDLTAQLRKLEREDHGG
jgi:hypothetical protein